MAGGRPSKLTPDTVKRLLDAVKIGVTYKDAALAAGISYDCLNDWMNAGKAATSGQYFQFFQSLTRAEAEARVGLVANIRGAGKKDWRASAWLLERHDPETYHLATKTQISGDSENPLEMKAHVTDSGLVGELAALLNTLGTRAARLSDGGGALPLDAEGAAEPTSPAG